VALPSRASTVRRSIEVKDMASVSLIFLVLMLTFLTKSAVIDSLLKIARNT